MTQQNIEVIALTPIKSGGVLRVPGTDTERFDVSLESYQSLKLLKAVRAASEVPESQQASANAGDDIAALTEQMRQAEAFLRHAVSVNDELAVEVNKLQTQVADMQKANAALQDELDEAKAALANAKPAVTDADAGAVSEAQDAPAAPAAGQTKATKEPKANKA